MSKKFMALALAPALAVSALAPVAGAEELLNVAKESPKDATKDKAGEVIYVTGDKNIKDSDIIELTSDKPRTDNAKAVRAMVDGKVITMQKSGGGTYTELFNIFADGVGLDKFGETDEDRRADLNAEYKIEILEVDQMKAPRVEEGYSSIDQLKENIYFGVNMSRQELIKYGIRENDWQPYNKFEYQRTPAHFEIVDGQYVRNKVFYGNLIETSLKWAKSSDYDTQRKNPQALIDHEASLKELIQDYKDAPGVIPYVIGFNSNGSYAKEYGVAETPREYFNSKWNGSESTGTFREVKGTTATAGLDALKVTLTGADAPNTLEYSYN